MAVTVTPAKDIFEYLRDNSIGIEGESLFYHNGPDGLTLQVCVMDSGGFDPDIYLDVDDKIRRPTIQISVRGTKYGFDTAYEKAKSIFALIDQQFNLQINSTRYISIHIIGDINDLGEDTNECPKLTINFVLCATGLPEVLETPVKQTPAGGFVGDFNTSISAEGIIVIGGDGVSVSEIQTSTDDGSTWIQQTIPPGTTQFLGSTFGNGIYMLVGKAFNANISISPDSISWTDVSPLTGSTLYDVAFGNNTYIVSAGNGYVFRSINAVDWIQSTPEGFYLGNYYSIVFGNGLFIITGINTMQLSANNGISWTGKTPIPLGDIYGSGYNTDTNTFLIVGENGQIQRSTDNGNAWISIANATGYTGDFRGISFGNGFWLIAGETGEIQSSEDDGLTWTHIVSANGYTGRFNDITFGDNIFTVVGDDGEIETISIGY